MPEVEIVLDNAGIRELLQSNEVASICEAQAGKMTRITGMQYKTDVYVGRNRVNVGLEAEGREND